MIVAMAELSHVAFREDAGGVDLPNLILAKVQRGSRYMRYWIGVVLAVCGGYVCSHVIQQYRCRSNVVVQRHH